METESEEIVESMRQLIAGGTYDVNLVRGGLTPLMVATIMGQAKIARVLLEGGAHINAKSDVGRTALMIAAINERTEVAEVLLDFDPDVKIKDKHGKTLVDYAKPEMVKLMTLKLLTNRRANAPK